RQQALAAGMTAAQIRGRLRRGEWETLRPRVYALAGSPPSRAQAVAAAVLSAGPLGRASHTTALWLHGLDNDDTGLHLVSAQPRWVRPPGTTAHRSATLFDDDLTVRQQIPTTTAERALIELSGRSRPGQLGLLVDDGLRAGVIKLERLRRCAARLLP